MIRIEAKNFDEAYVKASSELGCSITEITIDVIQNPSSGFLGMFKKTAIIEAKLSNEVQKNEKPRRSRNRKNKDSKPFAKKEPKNEVKVEESISNTKKELKLPAADKVAHEKKKPARKPRFEKAAKKPKVDMDIAVSEIKANVNNLFKYSCFDLTEVKVEAYNEDTVLVEFGGEDSALLIGKEGYRYKSLSYLLYNWINIKYNLNVRLEIAEFLQNQEEMIGKYLIGVIERINNTGRAQTKILDGVLVKIALEALRAEFPDKYVGIKSGHQGGKFIVINDFNRKN